MTPREQWLARLRTKVEALLNRGVLTLAARRQIGFTNAACWEAEGAQVGAVTCLLCGATILLDRRDQIDPTRLHLEWHDAGH